MITAVRLNTRGTMTNHNREHIEFTKEDRDNLRYILALHQEGEDPLDTWLQSLPEDDLQYALDLLKNYATMREHFLSYFD